MQRQFYLFILLFFITPGGHSENPQVLSCLEARKSFQEKRYGEAYEKASKACPTLRDLARWKQLRYARGDLTLRDYISFVKTHGHWPWMGGIRKTAERYLNKDVTDQQIIDWFQGHYPKSFRGLEAYLQALKNTGKKDLYKKVLLQEWHRMPLAVAQEEALLKVGKGILTQADHLIRLKYFFAKKNDRVVERQVDRCALSIRPYLRTRLAFLRNDPQAVHLYKALTKVEQQRLDIIHDYFGYLQRKESPQVYGFIKKHKVLFAQDPERFWRLRYIAARDALVHKKYGKVFKALEGHALTQGNAYMQTQFLLGFVALRFLNDPDLALTYFEPTYKHLSRPGSLARFAYWIAEAFAQQGNKEQAQKWLDKAKEQPQTFYGQEAFVKSGKPLELSFYRLHYKEGEYKAVMGNQYLASIRLLKALGFHEDVSPFLYKLYYALKGNGEKRAFLALCHKEFPEYLYDMARLAGVIYNYKETYPVLPETRVAKDIAMVNAIIRKESGFNPNAVSCAGARGLMQLMPGTAQIIGRQLGRDVSLGDLTADPQLNIVLGDAYFSQKLERFQGHKELTLAGYNAGPLNSDKWIARYGDPRKGDVDLLTWLEMVPYTETRSYVRRVIANYRVYQKLLEEGA